MGLSIQHFESETCSRCRGSGRYSWTYKWLDTCFKCGSVAGKPGSGFQLTRLGAKAREAWLAANTDKVLPAAITVGQLIRVNGLLRRVEEVLPDGGASRIEKDGTRTPGITFRLSGTRTAYTFWPDSLIETWTERLARPAEMAPGTERKAEMKALIAEAAKLERVAA